MHAVEPRRGLHRMLRGWLGSLQPADVVVEGDRPRPGEPCHLVDVAAPATGRDGGYTEGSHGDLTRGQLGEGAGRPRDRHRCHGPPGPDDAQPTGTRLEARLRGIVV